MPVPMLDLRAQYQRIRDEIEAAVADVFEKQQFIGGPRVLALEAALKAYTGAAEALSVASGTDALFLLLKAANLRPGDEVITTPFTFFATAGTIVNAGATPVFVDIQPDTFNIEPESIEAAITSRTRVLLPVHLFGHCADMDAINTIAQRHGLRVIEDACQALGALYKGRKACALAHAAAVSFFPSKNLGGAGDGGMVLAQDPELAAGVRLLRNHGSSEQYIHEIVGTNSRLDALQAAVLEVKLRHLDQWNAARRERAAYYTERLRDVPEIVTPVEQPGYTHVYHQYVVRVPRRDDARAFLQERGIGCAVYYPVPLHRQECFAGLGYGEGDLPVATRAAQEVLALPIYPELTPEQQDEVIAALKEHVAKG